ncbi:MAG: hypothetical protein ACXVA9_02335 [Bdellovibrionales bacterium]
MKTIIFALLLASPLAQAATVKSCADAYVGLTELMVPAAQNSRTYANNSVAVYNIDTEEPAAASAGLAIVIPDTKSEIGGALCFAVLRFRSVDVMNATSSYDAAKGLLLTIPAYENIDGESKRAITLKVRINQKNATVTLE